MSDFGNKLRFLRKSRGLTQMDLAREMDISPSAVGMYEQGNREPKVEMIIKASKFFSVSTDFLLGLQPSPQNVEDILMQIRNSVNSASGLTFNDIALGKEDTQKLFDSVLIAANILLGEKSRRAESSMPIVE